MNSETSKTTDNGPDTQRVADLSDQRNHDARGKFRPGNKAGKGNPHHKRLGKLREAQAKATTPRRMKRVWDAVMAKAEAGDMLAAKLVIEMVHGKAPQRVEIDTGGGQVSESKQTFDFAAFAVAWREKNSTAHIPGIAQRAIVNAQVIEDKEV